MIEGVIIDPPPNKICVDLAYFGDRKHARVSTWIAGVELAWVLFDFDQLGVLIARLEEMRAKIEPEPEAPLELPSASVGERWHEPRRRIPLGLVPQQRSRAVSYLRRNVFGQPLAHVRFRLESFEWRPIFDLPRIARDARRLQDVREQCRGRQAASDQGAPAQNEVAIMSDELRARIHTVYEHWNYSTAPVDKLIGAIEALMRAEIDAAIASDRQGRPVRYVVAIDPATSDGCAVGAEFVAGYAPPDLKGWPAPDPALEELLRTSRPLKPPGHWKGEKL